jgi:hypothetical protein
MVVTVKDEGGEANGKRTTQVVFLGEERAILGD